MQEHWIGTPLSALVSPHGRFPAPQHLPIITINPQNFLAIQAEGLAASVAARGIWLIRWQAKLFE
jgi:hypothetical protein